jgi:hypothetical protein
VHENRAAQVLNTILSKLDSTKRTSTIAWLALTLADALPKDETFPPFLSVFTSLFISEVLGQDPNGDPDRIRSAIQRFAREKPPDPAAMQALLRLMKESLDGPASAFAQTAMQAIGSEFHMPADPKSPASLESSPLGVRFGLRSGKPSER